MREICDIAWNVSESDYRADRAISYSTIATYAREGHKGLYRALFGDKLDSPSLQHGSLVDTILTDAENIDNLYVVSNYDKPSDIIKQICDLVWTKTDKQYLSLKSVPQEILLDCINHIGYGASNWKPETKINKVIEEGGSSYFSQLSLTINADKKLIHQSDFDIAQTCVDTLKVHPFTSWVFDTSDPDIKLYYQLKFKCAHNYDNPLAWKNPFNQVPDIDNIRCMFDILLVNYKEKSIQPIDLKTTSKEEEDFDKSLQDWFYDIQSTMYSHILRKICQADDYFKDFSVKSFKFMVINKTNLTPLIYDYPASVLEYQMPFKDYMGRDHLPWYDYLGRVKWHIKNNQFTYSVEAFKNNGIKTIRF